MSDEATWKARYERHNQERLEALNCNAWQAQEIARLRADLSAAQEQADRYLRHLTAGAQKMREVESALAAAQERERSQALPADDAEMVERVARALLVSEPEAYANSQELLDEHFEWWRAGRDDPESCVHYSSIGIAIRQARAALSAMRGEP